MVQLIILVVFFGGLVIGSLIASALGLLPSAEELEAEDLAREASLEPQHLGEQVEE